MTPKRIFNHDIMHCTHDAVVGNYLYCGRVLGMTEPEDLIQLHPDLQPEWKAIAAHYEHIGLSHSQNPIWDVSFTRLRDYPDYEVSVFIFGDAVHQASSDDYDWFRSRNRDWEDVVEFINSKNNFIRLANELGVSVPKTLCLNNKNELKDYCQIPYPCYLKPAVSVDGVGISRCENEQQLMEALETMDDNLPLQFQEEVFTSQFLNLQYFVTEKGAELLAATEQILNGYAHMGNRYPTVHQPWALVQPMADWMAQKGMRDIFAFDVAVVEGESEPRYLAIECNPRFNGASYPTGIAKKLKIDSWASETFLTKYRSLDDLDLKDIEFNPVTGTGVILVNWGCILVGKLGVLLAGSLEQQQELKELLKQRL
ncbi:ATP-grasp domain-containing protein [Pleurocapsales cyanobacterium LEGE 06147]|nr:ATP-grasp domain-containing protein [Pleurocapsales cyanobacterium LEGE 06147]